MLHDTVFNCLQLNVCSWGSPNNDHNKETGSLRQWGGGGGRHSINRWLDTLTLIITHNLYVYSVITNLLMLFSPCHGSKGFITHSALPNLPLCPSGRWRRGWSRSACRWKWGGGMSGHGRRWGGGRSAGRRRGGGGRCASGKRRGGSRFAGRRRWGGGRFAHRRRRGGGRSARMRRDGDRSNGFGFLVFWRFEGKGWIA